jgi:hypothetical protein
MQLCNTAVTFKVKMQIEEHDLFYLIYLKYTKFLKYASLV